MSILVSALHPGPKFFRELDGGTRYVMFKQFVSKPSAKSAPQHDEHDRVVLSTVAPRSKYGIGASRG